MTRSPTLPFEGRSPRRVWTVGELVTDAKFALEDAYARIWVRGEISNFRDVRGNWYFDLRDDLAVLPVVMFRSDNVRVPFRPEEGLESTACGRLSIFERAGRFQMIAAELEPAGRGAQQLAYEQLERKLKAEGLFAAERKRPVPQLPRSVGVVTSAEGAAWRDLLRVWSRRRTGLHVVLSPCRVQGENSGGEIADAIRLLDRHGSAEVIIVGRGGGSREDLWGFNDERVVRAIADCSVPVISAVGHEIDWTIADHVADARAATPTEAAELVARARLDLLDRIEGAHRTARNAVHHRLHRTRARLEHRDLHRRLERPARALEAYRQRLDDAARLLAAGGQTSVVARRERVGRASDRISRKAPERRATEARVKLRSHATNLAAAARTHRERARARRGAVAGRLDALNPLAVLSRGFSICRDEKGAVLRDTTGLAKGDLVRIDLHAGRLSARVEYRESAEPDEFVDFRNRC